MSCLQHLLLSLLDVLHQRDKNLTGLVVVGNYEPVYMSSCIMTFQEAFLSNIILINANNTI